MANADIQVERAEYDRFDKQAVYERHALRPQSHTIRVLDVRPISQDAIEGTPVECTLRIINLDVDPAFTALSYVWGDPTPTRSIVCDGVTFGVGENCYSALWHLSKKLGGLVVWVDAICIDQEDVRNEKAWQLPLMEDIFTKAEQVYVWLGRGDARSDRVMRYLAKVNLKRYVKFVPDGPPQYRSFAAALRLGISSWSLTYHVNPIYGNHKPLLARFTRRVLYITYSDLDYILNRPWKDRVWTYQEILLASHPVIVCGTEHVQWSDFEWTLLSLRTSFRYFESAAIAWEAIIFDRRHLQSINQPAECSVLLTLHEHQTILKKIISTRRWLSSSFYCVFLACAIAFLLLGFSRFAQGIRWWRIRVQLEGRISFLFMTLGLFGTLYGLILLYLAMRPTYQDYRGNLRNSTSDDLVGALYQRVATDPRDMAYGVWAILRKRGASDLSVPIYDVAREAQIPSLYRQLTIHLIQTTGNLQLLYIAAARRLPGSPSWIPDWSSFNNNTWRDVPGFPGTDLIRRSPESEDRLSKRRALQSVSIDSTQSVLTLLARETGVVCGCVSFYLIPATSLETDDKRAHLENLRSMLQWSDWTKAIGCKIQARYYEQPYDELAPISAAASWPSPEDRINWAKTLRWSTRDTLEAYLYLWMDGTEVPSWFRKFMFTQICLCNMIAELNRKICYVSISAIPGSFCLLACSDETKVNDPVLSVCGLPDCMVVRKRDELDDAVEIISPTFVQGSTMVDRHEVNVNNGGDIALDNLFREYHIH